MGQLVFGWAMVDVVGSVEPLKTTFASSVSRRWQEVLSSLEELDECDATDACRIPVDSGQLSLATEWQIVEMVDQAICKPIVERFEPARYRVFAF